MTKEQAIENLEEIIELSEDEINQDDKNITATLDLTDLKSLKTVLSMLKEKDIKLIETKEANRQLSIELKNKDKTIDLMAETINNHDIDEDICKQMGQKENCNEFEDKERCKDCIKQYFENEAKELLNK